MLKFFLENGLLLSMLGLVLASVMPARSAPPLRWDDEGGRFKPVVEADLPEGFPTYTPVGQIDVKKYPAYRKAETRGALAFWTLFSHIKQNQIAMTAPVEMTMQVDKAQRLQESSMAFLYGKSTLGTVGDHGTVAVVDIPAMQVVSIGIRGPRSEAALADAHERLRQWLAEHKEQYVENGSARVMGYNSPFVPRDRQFHELQIPVREVSNTTPNQPASGSY